MILDQCVKKITYYIIYTVTLFDFEVNFAFGGGERIFLGGMGWGNCFWNGVEMFWGDGMGELF